MWWFIGFVVLSVVVSMAWYHLVQSYDFDIDTKRSIDSEKDKK